MIGREQGPYQGYLYGYPHKTAYRAIEPGIPIADVWAAEDRSALALYAHVPFCAQRCAFCNLFTTATGARERERAWLDALVLQAEAVSEAVGDASYATVAVGGGTPTWLEPSALDGLFDVLEHTMGARLGSVPLGVECSPETVTPEKADLLARRGTTRVSMGVQSFVEREARSVGRTQRDMTVQSALQALRDARIPTLNLDLIYGLRGQDAASWQVSLECALEWRPEEIFLYPLYVRPLTGLGRQDRAWDDARLALYRQGRDLLRMAGYTQVSMRMFRSPDAPDPSASGAYRCQTDGTVGLGPGARSTTAGLHWSTPFAVGAGAVLQELDAWLGATAHDHVTASWGIALDATEQRRRYALLGLLQAEGLDRAAYTERFGVEVLEALPGLEGWVRDGWLEAGERLRLTDEGLAWSDAVGPALISEAVRARMDTWEVR